MANATVRAPKSPRAPKNFPAPADPAAPAESPEMIDVHAVPAPAESVPASAESAPADPAAPSAESVPAPAENLQTALAGVPALRPAAPAESAPADGASFGDIVDEFSRLISRQTATLLRFYVERGDVARRALNVKVCRSTDNTLSGKFMPFG